MNPAVLTYKTKSLESRRQKALPYILVGPYLVFLLVFVAFPVLHQF